MKSKPAISTSTSINASICSTSTNLTANPQHQATVPPEVFAHQTPVSLSPSLAVGALLAAAFINNAAEIPPDAHIDLLLYLSISAMVLFAPMRLALQKKRLRSVNNPWLKLRLQVQIRTLAYLKNNLLRASAALLSAWLLLSLACNDARQWLSTTVASTCEGVPLSLQIEIDDVPTVIDGQGRVNVKVQPGQSAQCGQLPQRISLGWNAETEKAETKKSETKSADKTNVETKYVEKKYSEAKHTEPKSTEPKHVEWSPSPGERWLAHLTLKRPITTLNFDGFDVHHYWLREGIGALGRLTPPHRAPVPQRLTPHTQTDSTHTQTLNAEKQVAGSSLAPTDQSPHGDQNTLSISHIIARYRQALAHRISTALPDKDHPHQGILLGLSVGLQKSISPQQWNVLSATGTSHLVSISGMHVTLLAGWLAWLVIKFWQRIPALALSVPAKTAAAVISLPVAALYAALAGWGVPAQRTIIMLALGTVLALLNHRGRPLDLLCLSAAIVAITNPWSATSAGFLLSFGAVGILIFSSAGRASHLAPRFPWLQKLAGEHVTVFIGLMPLSVALFGQYSWVSPAANLLAVGWMGLITTPLILSACLLNADLLMQMAHASLTPVWWALEQLAAFSLAWQPVAPPPLAITLLSILGGLLALMPSGLMLRAPGLLLVALPFLWPTSKPQHGEFELTILDIGQGNSMAVRTATHTLLVDAGNATSPRNDQGRMTVLPWLYHRGQRHWDAVIVSHNDSDHAGGMGGVLQASRTGTLYANPPFRPPPASEHISKTRPCIAGTQWEWDGVQFSILYPSASDLHTETEDNAISCVLRIRSAHGSALFPGDIGIEQEEKLLERLDPAALQSDLVMVPHHGSETSSSSAFVQATRARWAVFQVGYRNRYGHPKPGIVRTWHAAGAQILRTDHTGALQLSVKREGTLVSEARQTRRRFWHLPPVPEWPEPSRPIQKVHGQQRRLHQQGATISDHSLSE